MLQACDGRCRAQGMAARAPSGPGRWRGRRALVSARARHGAQDGGATSRVAIRVQRPAKAAGGSTGAGAADEASLRFPTRPRSQALKVMGEGVSAARWEQ